MSTTGSDLRYALRSMRRNPGFAALAVSSLALGIGVNTAMFGLVDQLLLWSVPARDPARLVSVEGMYVKSYPFYREFRDRNQVFSGLLATSGLTRVGIRPEGAPEIEVGHLCYVSGNYFETLGVGAAAGRVIATSDDVAPGGSPVAVLSYSYWQRRFAGSFGVIGRKLAINGYPLEIVGIAEKGFGGIVNTEQADAFVPVTMFPTTTPAAARVWNTTGMFWLTPMARLKPGVSMAQAQAAMRVLAPQVAEAVNDAAVKAGRRRRNYRNTEVTLTPGAHGVSGGRNAMIDPLRALLLATGLVLLIACANVANLLLARASGRRKEIAIRLSAGATRGRLVRQLLTESLLLAVVGGAIGLACAYGCVLALAKTHLVDPDLRFRASALVAAFSVGVTLLTGILFGLAPAFRSTRMQLAEAVKDGGGTGMATSRLRFGKVLIAVQAALSLTLLAGAGLFVRTLRNLERVDIGFQKENVVIVDVDPTKLGYSGHRLRTFYDDLLARTRRLPGVRAAALSTMTPLGEFALTRSFSAEGYQEKPGERMMALSNPVSSRYFTTLGIPMLLGRDFRAEDDPAITPGDTELGAMGRVSGGSNQSSADAPRVCIVNESLARHLFGGSNPVGRHLSFQDRYSAESGMEIVGVVKDVRNMAIREADSEGIVYTPSWGISAEARWVGVRVSGDAAPAIAAIRRALREMDANVPVLRVRTLVEDVNARVHRERLIAYLCSFFGVLALGLASVGLYGVMAYGVTQRTREVGIRMALGAERGDVVAMIVRESLVPVLIGIVAGLGGAIGLSRFVAGMLYGVAPRDPVSLALAALVMLAVAVLAAAIPARRASRVEPVAALHYE